MLIIREPHIVSGFLYDDPLPAPSPITHCGEAVSVARHSLAWHSHPGFELLYLVRGRYPWHIEDSEYRQCPGDLLIVYPRQQHRTDGQAPEEAHHLWIGVHLTALGAPGRILADHLFSRGRHLLADCRDIEPILRGIIAQVVTPRPAQRRVVRAYLDLLVSIVLQRLDTTVGSRSVVQPYSYPIQKVLYFMQTQLDRRLPLPQAAAVAGWGVTQLCAQFRTQVGTTPGRHHLRLRLEAARAALRVPGMTVTRAAAEFGFTSSQHLATHFRRAFGQTPTTWQRIGPSSSRR
jgi:AraC-like DNA-binding protein